MRAGEVRGEPLTDPEGVRFVPHRHVGVGALVLAGSSGRVDVERARVLSTLGVVAESVRWFGGEGQHDGPWEIPLELLLGRVAALRETCDRVLVLGTSFGAEAAMLTGTLTDDVDAVVAFAPSDVVWAGVTAEGRVTSHWTRAGAPVPYLPFAADWTLDHDPPAYVGLYRRSWAQATAPQVAAATIPAERVRDVVLVVGGDDQVWPAAEQAERIVARRAGHGLPTTLVADAGAGHRTLLPGEPVVEAGVRMRRGGTEEADRRLGVAAWAAVVDLVAR